ILGERRDHGSNLIGLIDLFDQRLTGALAEEAERQSEHVTEGGADRNGLNPVGHSSGLANTPVRSSPVMRTTVTLSARTCSKNVVYGMVTSGRVRGHQVTTFHSMRISMKSQPSQKLRGGCGRQALGDEGYGSAIGSSCFDATNRNVDGTTHQR